MTYRQERFAELKSQLRAVEHAADQLRTPSAEAQLDELAQQYQQSHPDTPYTQAFAVACELRPDLAAEYRSASNPQAADFCERHGSQATFRS